MIILSDSYVPESNTDYIQDEKSFQEMIDMNKKQNEMFEINDYTMN